jgi:hypothetical protein
MAVQFLTQRLVLLRERLVAVEPTPLSHLRESSAQAARGRLSFHHPIATPRTTPVVREAQQVKRPGASAGVESRSEKEKEKEKGTGTFILAWPSLISKGARPLFLLT